MERPESHDTGGKSVFGIVMDPNNVSGWTLRSGSLPLLVIADIESELREELGKLHKVEDHHSFGQPIQPRGHGPAEVHGDVPSLQLVLKNLEQSQNALVNASPLQGQPEVGGAHPKGNALPRGEEHNEGFVVLRSNMPNSTSKEALRRIKTTIFNDTLQMMDVEPKDILRRGAYGRKPLEPS